MGKGTGWPKIAMGIPLLITRWGCERQVFGIYHMIKMALCHDCCVTDNDQQLPTTTNTCRPQPTKVQPKADIGTDIGSKHRYMFSHCVVDISLIPLSLCFSLHINYHISFILYAPQVSWWNHCTSDRPTVPTLVFHIYTNNLYRVTPDLKSTKTYLFSSSCSINLQLHSCLGQLLIL